MDALRERPSSARAYGDVRATLERLYVDHARLVNAICARTLRDRTEVEDAVQQVFLSAFQALANGGRPRNSAAWLATIARNECLRRRRTPPPVALADDDVVASDGDPAVFGDGLQVRDFTYVDDAVDATVRAVSAVSPPAILNVGGYEEQPCSRSSTSSASSSDARHNSTGGLRSAAMFVVPAPTRHSRAARSAGGRPSACGAAWPRRSSGRPD